jgi:hypothetical protein
MTDMKKSLFILYWKLNIKPFKSKKFFIRPNITTSNARAFKEFLHPMSVLPNSNASWRVRVIYASKGVMKMLGCTLYIRCALSIEKYSKICLMYISLRRITIHIKYWM